MDTSPDPFRFHPELSGKIDDPIDSFFRSITIADLKAKIQAQGLPVDWWHTEEEREASRLSTLSSLGDDDLWVFGYGSLMWDPGFLFTEVRRAHTPNHARCFILKDIYGGRGTIKSPGLMAALDLGDGCNGLAFKIDREAIEKETRILWQREKIGPAYQPDFVTAEIDGQPVRVLTFVADHNAELIDASLSREQKIHYLATGSGVFGTSLSYLRNIASHFDALGIHDTEVAELLTETENYLGKM